MRREESGDVSGVGSAPSTCGIAGCFLGFAVSCARACMAATLAWRGGVVGEGVCRLPRRYGPPVALLLLLDVELAANPEWEE